MAKPPPHPEPQQQRSRKTQEKLLTAALRVMALEGLDAATIPRIAKQAGVAPASVYRRFADKDALLREAFLEWLRRINAANQERLAPALVRKSLPATAARLMHLLFAQYRSCPHLFRALARFIEQERDSDFAQQALDLDARNLSLLVDVLLAAHGAEVRRSPARRAMQFAVLQAATSIEVIVLEHVTLWGTVLPLTDAQLERELARSFVAYLK